MLGLFDVDLQLVGCEACTLYTNSFGKRLSLLVVFKGGINDISCEVLSTLFSSTGDIVAMLIVCTADWEASSCGGCITLVSFIGLFRYLLAFMIVARRWLTKLLSSYSAYGLGFSPLLASSVNSPSFSIWHYYLKLKLAKKAIYNIR